MKSKIKGHRESFDDPTPTGYVARKLIHRVNCEEYQRFFDDKDKPLDLNIDEQHLLFICVSSSLECSLNIYKIMMTF